MEEFDLPHRKIIHVDMDAFYASVEQLDNPELKGKPLAVGGGGERGVVAAASYEARKFGVRSAMSGALARQKCPELLFVKPRFERYKEVSEIIREIFYEYTELVEPLSLDEAFLDVTDNQNNHHSATEIAKEIRDKIFLETGLTASAGISINKFMAKIASDINKPNGQKTIKPNEVEAFLEKLPIDKFFGIGKATSQKMHSWGIFNGRQLKQHSLEFLTANFGKAGKHYYNIVRGIQNSPVRPNRERKSVGAERTYAKNITRKKDAREALVKIAGIIEERLRKSRKKGKTITLKIKFSDFTQITRSRTIESNTWDKTIILEVIWELYTEEEFKKSIRLLGISISNFNPQHQEKEENKASQLRFDF
ncbi:MAG: DNA polymerase IV [Crocinitomicaceae bacterium]|nr:DNA polymerase IV [Crocinitomicaceae bacterium]